MYQNSVLKLLLTPLLVTAFAVTAFAAEDSREGISAFEETKKVKEKKDTKT